MLSRYFCVSRRVLVGSSVPAGHAEACEARSSGCPGMTCDLRQELQSSEQGLDAAAPSTVRNCPQRGAHAESKATSRIGSFTDDDHWDVDPRHEAPEPQMAVAVRRGSIAGPTACVHGVDSENAPATRLDSVPTRERRLRHRGNVQRGNSLVCLNLARFNGWVLSSSNSHRANQEEQSEYQPCRVTSDHRGI